MSKIEALRVKLAENEVNVSDEGLRRIVQWFIDAPPQRRPARKSRLRARGSRRVA